MNEVECVDAFYSTLSSLAAFRRNGLGRSA